MADAASLTDLPATETASRTASLADPSPDEAPPAEHAAAEHAAEAAEAAVQGSETTAPVPAAEPPAAEPPIAEPPITETAAAETPTAAPPPAATPAPEAGRDRPPAPARRGGFMFNALFALLSLAGAAVALTAPALRPHAYGLARAWLGDASPVLPYLAAAPAPGAEPPVPAELTYPPPAFQAPESVNGDTSLQAAALAAVRAEMIATLRLELDGVRRAAAEQAARLAAAGVSARAAQSDASAARGEAHAAAAAADSVVRAQDAIAHAQEAASRAIDAAAERLDRLETQVAVSDARGRATGLMVAASGLHRDILSGAPLHDDLAALAGAAPLPASVQQSLDQLARSDGGVPTLRDLGVGFEAVDAAIIARGGGQGSWFTLSGWFGGANADRATLDRLRAMAAEGRFSEVADTLERTDWADLAQRWSAQVRQRSAAVIAGQTVLAHAQALYEASLTTPPAWPLTLPSAAPRRVSP